MSSQLAVTDTRWEEIGIRVLDDRDWGLTIRPVSASVWDVLEPLDVKVLSSNWVLSSFSSCEPIGPLNGRPVSSLQVLTSNRQRLFFHGQTKDWTGKPSILGKSVCKHSIVVLKLPVFFHASWMLPWCYPSCSLAFFLETYSNHYYHKEKRRGWPTGTKEQHLDLQPVRLIFYFVAGFWKDHRHRLFDYEHASHVNIYDQWVSHSVAVFGQQSTFKPSTGGMLVSRALPLQLLHKFATKLSSSLRRDSPLLSLYKGPNSLLAFAIPIVPKSSPSASFFPSPTSVTTATTSDG